MTIKLLTLDEAAERVRTSPNTMRYWRHKGDGPPSALIGRRVMYREDLLEAWVAEQFAPESGAA